MNMLREQALPYVSYLLDDSLNVEVVKLSRDKGWLIPSNAVLVGWQCGFEPMFVAVKSYLPNVTLEQDEAVGIATDYLLEIGWFAEVDPRPISELENMAIEPDYIIGGRI
jgi:hypothetical protein